MKTGRLIHVAVAFGAVLAISLAPTTAHSTIRPATIGYARYTPSCFDRADIDVEQICTTTPGDEGSNYRYWIVPLDYSTTGTYGVQVRAYGNVNAVGCQILKMYANGSLTWGSASWTLGGDNSWQDLDIGSMSVSTNDTLSVQCKLTLNGAGRKLNGVTWSLE